MRTLLIVIIYFIQLIYFTTDLGYECIATWKDGSDMYLYAKMSGSSIRTKDDSYRCFVSVSLNIVSADIYNRKYYN